jgi:FkbM family methyltransferase
MSEPLPPHESIYDWMLDLERRRQARMVRRLPPKLRAKLQGGLTLSMLASPYRVETPRGSIAFALLGLASANRATSALSKQPDTITWIDSFRPDSVFWDVGANVGVYSLYAALRSDISITAFEPAAVNYFLLTANCELNKVEDRVDCLLLGLGDSRRIERMELSQFEPASSFSFRGKRSKPRAGRQAAFVLSMDQLIEDYGLRCPNYIKIDVPHLAEEIIRGGARTLPREEVRELHIEASEESTRDRQLIKLLDQFGFTITGRHDRSGVTDLTLTKRA